MRKGKGEREGGENERPARRACDKFCLNMFPPLMIPPTAAGGRGVSKKEKGEKKGKGREKDTWWL